MVVLEIYIFFKHQQINFNYFYIQLINLKIVLIHLVDF